VNYHDHPLLQGFADLPDDQLIEVAVSQLDIAAWIKGGAKWGKDGIPKDVQEILRDGLAGTPREGLEMFLYHAIVMAVKANEEAQGRGKDNTISPAAG